MQPRRLFALCLFAPLFFGGCGAVSTVRTAFEMPVAPTPSPRELARARETKGFDSLSKSVAKLNAETIRKILGTKASSSGTSTRQPWQPSPFGARPALSLIGDLSRGTNVPIAPSEVAVYLQNAGSSQTPLLADLVGNTTRAVGGRRLFSAGLGSTGGGLNDSARAFLQAWASRESLRRSDEELLGRRALEDRIAFNSRLDLPALDLSLVSPETQLELSNLRLKLIPLLQVPRSQRAQAAAEIEAIEARLNQIWEQETARQAALLRQSLVEIPARLRQEGESVLNEQTRQSAAQTQKRLAQVRQDLENRLPLPPVSSLSIRQEATVSPNSAVIRAQLNSSLGAGRVGRPTTSPIVSQGNSAIARRGSNPASRVPSVVAAKNERIWRVATG